MYTPHQQDTVVSTCIRIRIYMQDFERSAQEPLASLGNPACQELYRNVAMIRTWAARKDGKGSTAEVQMHLASPSLNPHPSSFPSTPPSFGQTSSWMIQLPQRVLPQEHGKAGSPPPSSPPSQRTLIHMPLPPDPLGNDQRKIHHQR